MLAQGITLGTGSLKIALDAFSLWKNPTPPSHVALQLPVEILQKIFLLLAELYASERVPNQNPTTRPDWIAITHVCRYWRSAALGLRELWSSITPGLSISWSQAMMERSAPLPVRIDIRISTSSTDGLHPLAASELLFAASRIRTLRLVGLRTDILRVLDRLRSPSPLESLDSASSTADSPSTSRRPYSEVRPRTSAASHSQVTHVSARRVGSSRVSRTSRLAQSSPCLNYSTHFWRCPSLRRYTLHTVVLFGRKRMRRCRPRRVSRCRVSPTLLPRHHPAPLYDPFSAYRCTSHASQTFLLALMGRSELGPVGKHARGFARPHLHRSRDHPT
ncbi:hypothetical protein EI94DRAFT_1325452 [Lactarius quietus]|nr:hypothetical protein EI94DRAFT_1325452 [Lactarius quietus]